jgi:hypothetical protein
LRELPVCLPAVLCFSYPRCSVISSSIAVSIAVLVSCLRRPSGPVTVRYRAHLDLATSSAAHEVELIAHLLELGATPADVGQGDVPWTVLAEPEGNVFCVLEPRPIYRDTGPILATSAA